MTQRLRVAGLIVGFAALLGILVAYGTDPRGQQPPVPAQAAPLPSAPDDQIFSLLPCLDVPELRPIMADDAAAQVKEITARIEETRGHRFGQDPVPEFVTDQEIRRRIIDKINTEYTADEADAERRILAALGAVPADVDLRALVTDLLGGQVIGFYDTKTEELVVAAPDPLTSSLGLVAQSTLAHELDHALIDAVIGLPDEQLEGPSDAALAMLALVEGDAVLAQERFLLSAVTPGQALSMADAPEVRQAQEQLQDFPYVLRAELSFPYGEGAVFVCSLFARGGWQAVDAAYRAPPTTSAQILFPQRYASREGATDPRDPGALGGTWTRAQTDTIGAADLLWLFQAPGDDLQAGIDNPLGAAGAWAGGDVHLWTDGPASAVGIALVDRTSDGALCAAVARWYRAAFPGDRAAERRPGERLASDGSTQDAVLRCAGREVRLGIAPDLATARALAS